MKHLNLTVIGYNAACIVIGIGNWRNVMGLVLGVVSFAGLALLARRKAKS